PWSSAKATGWPCSPNGSRSSEGWGSRMNTARASEPALEHAGRDAAAWRAADLDRDPRWVHALDDSDRNALRRALESGRVDGKPLLDYRHSDFDFGASLRPIRRALDEAQHGLGAALVKGLPRQDLSAEEFELLTWAIG